MAKKAKPLSATVSNTEYVQIVRRQIEAQKAGIVLDADQALADMKRDATEAKQTAPPGPRTNLEARLMKTQENLAKLVHLTFSGTYLGGHPTRDRAQGSASLVIGDNGIRVKHIRTLIHEPWTNITALAAERAG